MIMAKFITVNSENTWKYHNNKIVIMIKTFILHLLSLHYYCTNFEMSYSLELID